MSKTGSWTMLTETEARQKAAREQRAQGGMLVAVGALSFAAFLMSALALYWHTPPTQVGVDTAHWMDSLLNFAGIAIAGVSMMGTFGFLIFAFGIWDTKKNILDDRKGFEELYERALKLIEETHDIKEDARRVLNEAKARHSNYQDIYESLMLYNTIIRYIGNPLWEEQEPDDDGPECERERVDRHISLTRLLMTMFAKDAEKDTDMQDLIDLLRDAVGHLRPNDDEIFFEFLENRLDRIEPKFESDRDTVQEIRRRFKLISRSQQ